MRRIGLIGALAAVFAMMVTVGTSTAGARTASGTCATNADQWLGTYSGTARFSETGSYYTVLVEVGYGAAGALWAEVDHPELNPSPQWWETDEVTLSAGVLTIVTWKHDPDYPLIEGIFKRTYRGTSVSCDSSGAVTSFGGALDSWGWAWHGPIGWSGSFEVART